MKNKQLTSIQRNQIEVLLKTNTPIKRVAQLLETDKSTIYREINRNKKKRSYSARFAQELCTERKERSGRARKFTDQAKNFVIEKLKKEQWSPNQIVGFARLNNITSDNGSEFAQHELMAKKAERRFLFCTPILFQGKGIE